ncbi:1,2-phenylacetyl-CoA epoxidase subunit PaaC [Streptomyces johnsoniae]|uniref:1,2-phenylacetyl-CoA epoxidase subunit PaaC n=1 Tax=Streptomyces johnsoniae TaxID=3075532 RepID=A0ABU2SBJ5_9ACTN|nr:1,2-phenylacetyl-CoA epoxidase subunit PaaC [Streptomyces sp. DSM 41886]MDT0446041.1 1,2-phenylacetyl-CoA epoxidase subunit PaaC [Streptomyces sp. DSM 41886]
MTAPALTESEREAALALGDDALILSHRLAEWAGHAPVLEEEVALANLALDLLGQARALLSLAGDEDELAFRRDARDFRNLQLVEQPNGDFAHTVVRQLFHATWQELLYAQLASGGGPFAAIAAHAAPETRYHRDHAVTWTLRLGDGTAQSHARTGRAVRALWRFTGELFEPVPGLAGTDRGALRAAWTERVTETLRAATLPVPEAPAPPTAWSAGGGRRGIHTEPFGRLLAEMQHLHRSHPGAAW